MTWLKTTTCIVAIFAASGAMADVTAQQVWDSWKKNLSSNPDMVVTTTSEEAGDGVLVIEGLSVNMTSPDEAFSMTIGDVSFTEQDAGTVSVQMPDSFLIEVQSSDADSTLMEISQSGEPIIVSGTPDALAYRISTNRYALSVLEVIQGGEPTLDGDILITLNDLYGNYSVANNDLREIDYIFEIGSVDLLVDITEPNSTDNVVVSGKIAAVQTRADIAAPPEVADPDMMFLDGFAFAVDTTFDAANLVFDVTDAGTTSRGSAGFGPGASAIAINKDRFDYSVNASDVAVNITSGDLPFPVDLDFAEFETGLAMPLSVTEEPEDFSFNVRLADASISDGIWAMGDPSGTLPRDPITVSLALNGKTKLFFDLADPAQETAREMADAPGELHALNIDTLLLSAVGARVSGSGAFTFDNDDYATFDGIPRPLGDATFEINGANALMDNLVAMGLLPADQASMGRLMMGMFARTTGDDQLRTTVEMNDQGHLIVNGQRMQ